MKTDNVVKSLQRFGIQAAAYRRPPTGPDIFALSIQPRSQAGVVTINQGTASVEVFGSRKLRQAAVNVRENGRKIVRNVKVIRRVIDHINPPGRDEQIRLLTSNFPVTMPSNTRWTVKDITCTRHDVQTVREHGGYLNTYDIWKIKGTVTARVIRRTELSFLIGMDETHHFVAPLPKKVASVKEAHKVLRPDVKRGSLRQGEWFFEPVSDEALIKTLNGHADARMYRRQGRFRLGGTTHFAMTHINLVHRRQGDKRKAKHLYVRGDIIDGREGHHAVLFLPGWHRVVRNKEDNKKFARVQRATAGARTAGARRSWD